MNMRKVNIGNSTGPCFSPYVANGLSTCPARRRETRTRQSFNNVGAMLKAAGTGFYKVIKRTCFLQDMDDFKPFSEVYVQ
jgi:enamine deaminase RidA (YjgF/YER057c/UK114 family)